MKRDPIEGLTGELRAARERVASLQLAMCAEHLAARPSPGEWSVRECIAHLNLTSRAYLPLLGSVAETLRAEGAVARRPPRRDFVGWMLCRVIEPPARHRTRTATAFEPSDAGATGTAFEEFAELQDALIAFVAATKALPLDRARVRSPFDSQLRYNAWSALRIIAAHQRRHLAQADAVLGRVRLQSAPSEK